MIESAQDRARPCVVYNYFLRSTGMNPSDGPESDPSSCIVSMSGPLASPLQFRVSWSPFVVYVQVVSLFGIAKFASPPDLRSSTKDPEGSVYLPVTPVQAVTTRVRAVATIAR